MLDERLVACANIPSPKRSLIFCLGEHSEAEEAGVLFKIDAALQDWRCEAAFLAADQRLRDLGC